jgi:death-on-curing protein
MNSAPIFLTLQDIIFIHAEEIRSAGGEPNIRDSDGIKACVDAPQVSYGGEFLQDIFEMAASYITCIAIRHPFVDGNKRTALASALTFLYVNGLQINESTDLELAELILDFLNKSKSKDDIAIHFRTQCFSI